MLKYLPSILLLTTLDVLAITCTPSCEPVINTTINASLNSSQNERGKIIPSDTVSSGSFIFKFDSNEGGAIAEWFVYPGQTVPPYSYNGAGQEYSFTKVDDYISIAAKYTSNCGNTFYAPYNIPVLYQGNCEIARYDPGTTVLWYPRQFTTALRIDKPIISGVYNKNILVAEYGLCWSGNKNVDACQFKGVTLMRLYASINLTVPQSCELNSGQVINIDFGNISSGAFKTAGAIAQGVQPKSRDISIKCDNIAGNAQLTLRMQADKTNGNIVVSDENNDVGFRVTNDSGTPLIPNNLSSVIPFTLDSNARQNVTIQAYPVSVTGNKPTEGPVTSRAYLRVDFP